MTFHPPSHLRREGSHPQDVEASPIAVSPSVFQGESLWPSSPTPPLLSECRPSSEGSQRDRTLGSTGPCVHRLCSQKKCLGYKTDIEQACWEADEKAGTRGPLPSLRWRSGQCRELQAGGVFLGAQRHSKQGRRPAWPAGSGLTLLSWKSCFFLKRSSHLVSTWQTPHRSRGYNTCSLLDVSKTQPTCLSWEVFQWVDSTLF